MTADIVPFPTAPDAVNPMTPATVRQGVQLLRDLLDQAYENLNLADYADDPALLASLVNGLQDLERDASVWLKEAKRLLIPHVQDKGSKVGSKRLLNVEGATVTVSWSRKRSDWDSTRLYAKVVQDAADAVPLSVRVLDDNGVLTDRPDPAEVVTAVAVAIFDVLPVTPSTGWRVTALRERGIDPAEWCHEDDAVPSVTVTHHEVALDAGPCDDDRRKE